MTAQADSTRRWSLKAEIGASAFVYFNPEKLESGYSQEYLHHYYRFSYMPDFFIKAAWQFSKKAGIGIGAGYGYLVLNESRQTNPFSGQYTASTLNYHTGMLQASLSLKISKKHSLALGAQANFYALQSAKGYDAVIVSRSYSPGTSYSYPFYYNQEKQAHAVYVVLGYAYELTKKHSLGLGVIVNPHLYRFSDYSWSGPVAGNGSFIRLNYSFRIY